MSVKILKDADRQSCFYCSTTMWAFGPVIGSEYDADEFLEWLPQDPRRYTDQELENMYYTWIRLKRSQDEGYEEDPEPSNLRNINQGRND